MSKKSAKIASFLAEMPGAGASGETSLFDPHYLGFFECFNRQMHYEAHDVLEDLWLETDGSMYFFYKGLIQVAGAFVHLKKSKLNPAARLFRLALKNLEPHMPHKEGLDVAELVKRIQGWLKTLEDSDYTHNPYDPQHPPQLIIEGGQRKKASP